MPIKKLFLIMLFLTSSLFAQQLQVSRDSLFIFPVQSNDWLGADTIIVYNVGNDTLRIDHLESKNQYSYPLNIFYQDTNFYYKVLISNPLNLAIAPTDSAMFIFGTPDLCPICKVAFDSMEGNFVDSIYIYSNSQNPSTKILYATGIGMETGIDDFKPTATNFLLLNNFPNPFNETTTIRFTLPAASRARIDIFDTSGHLVKRLLDQRLTAGRHQLQWQARDHASGVYFCQLVSDMGRQIQKMILLK